MPLLLLLTSIQANAQTATVKTSLNNVINAYLDLKNALVAGNSTAGGATGKVLKAQIEAVSVKGMPADQKGVWKNYVDKLSFDSRHISESTDIAHQREHFASLSKNMYAVLKIFNVNSTVIYWQYCPMKKMSWLSEKPAIENPYHGKQMLDCGKTVETMKPAK